MAILNGILGLRGRWFAADYTHFARLRKRFSGVGDVFANPDKHIFVSKNVFFKAENDFLHIVKVFATVGKLTANVGGVPASP